MYVRIVRYLVFILHHNVAYGIVILQCSVWLTLCYNAMNGCPTFRHYWKAMYHCIMFIFMLVILGVLMNAGETE